MTNLPSWVTTAGLNVPEDSQESPRGVMMGPSEARCHALKGALPLARSSNTEPISTSTKNRLRPVKRRDLIPFVTFANKLGRWHLRIGQGGNAPTLQGAWEMTDGFRIDW